MIKKTMGQREEMEGGIKDTVKGWNGENATQREKDSDVMVCGV